MLRRRDLFSETYCGGYSGEDPPLPIPNREVKLTIADGTAPPGGRVGSCHALTKSLEVFDFEAFFVRASMSQPQSASLTAPFRGMPTAPFSRVGRPRCFDVLGTSRWRG